jgi:phosphoglucosamine mutase
MIRTQVGDRYVIEAMRQHGYLFGGEQSGHLIFLEHSTTGDGILASLQVMAIMKQKGKKLSQLAQCIHVLPQVLLNVRVKTKKNLDGIESLIDLQDKIEKALGEKGRLLLRYSGTEPVLRIMLEGEKLDKIQEYAQDLKQEAEKALGRA